MAVAENRVKKGQHIDATTYLTLEVEVILCKNTLFTNNHADLKAVCESGFRGLQTDSYALHGSRAASRTASVNTAIPVPGDGRDREEQ